MSTPRASSQKKQPPSASQSAKSQKSILGFFQKQTTKSPTPVTSTANTVPASTPLKTSFTKIETSVTPQPSSDPVVEQSSPIKKERESSYGKNKENGLSSLGGNPSSQADRDLVEVAGVVLNSPSRKVCSILRAIVPILILNHQARKPVNYAESDEEEEDEVFNPIANGARKGRATKRRRVVIDDESDDEFALDEATQQAMAAEDGM